jgi:hypothetical protein
MPLHGHERIDAHALGPDRVHVRFQGHPGRGLGHETPGHQVRAPWSRVLAFTGEPKGLQKPFQERAQPFLRDRRRRWSIESGQVPAVDTD